MSASAVLTAHGTTPPGVENPTLYRMRSGGALLPKHVAGLELLKPVHFLESDSVAIPVEASVGGA